MAREGKEKNQLLDEIAFVARETARLGLNHATTGNVSVRVSEGFFISATGTSLRDLTAADMVFVPTAQPDEWIGPMPSSEWPFHATLYTMRPDVHAIVHCHSDWATVAGIRNIAVTASLHYMKLAIDLNPEARLPWIDYWTPGSLELAKAIGAGIGNANGCLLANHGQIALGRSPKAALHAAEIIEKLCFYACLCSDTPISAIPSDELVATHGAMARYLKK